MTHGKRRNVGASVRARLMNRSRETSEDFQFLLERYARERFLYRLGESQHRERYVLKGATLLVLWGEAVYRPTHDLDFADYGSPLADDVRSAIGDICETRVDDDGVFFDSGDIKVKPIRAHEEDVGFRVLFWAKISSARIRMQIDIGFGNAIQPPIDAHYPTLLDAARPRIRVYPREAVVAEKLHAMVVLGERNSRYKDFYDLHSLSQRCVLSRAISLVRAIGATFEKRRTATIFQNLPVALTPRFYDDANRAEQWRIYLERNELPGTSSDFGTVGELVSCRFSESHGMRWCATPEFAWKLVGSVGLGGNEAEPYESLRRSKGDEVDDEPIRRYWG